MNILITGAAGFVGSHLIRAFAARGHSLSAIDRGTSPLFGELGVRHYAIDLLDEYAVARVIDAERPDAIVHLAAIASVPYAWEHPAKAIEVNAGGTASLVTAMARFASKARLLFVGSSDIYGLTAKCGNPLTEGMPAVPQNPYSISKLCAEQLAMVLGKKFHLSVIATRSFNHFGPGQKRGFVVSDFASQIAEIERGEQEPVIYVGDLSASRDFTYIDDIISAYVALIENEVPNGIYNVCSGVPRVIKKVLDRLISLSKKDIAVKIDPEKMRPVDVPFYIGDNTKLKNAVKWETKSNFDEGLKRTLDYWRTTQ